MTAHLTRAGLASSAPRTRPLTRVPGIEGLRALAASSIVVFHVWIYGSPSGAVDAGYLSRFALPHLPVGVTLFFALSGYLLYRPIVASLLTRGSLPDVRNYLRNRGLRILPAYWVVLIIVAVVLPAALLRRSPSELSLDRLISRPDTLISNALFVQNYVPGSLDTGIGPAWSLAVEVVFYLSLPVLAVLARAGFRRACTARGRVLALLAPPAALLLLGTAGKAATVLLEDHDPGSDILARSFLSLADLFAPGMALAVLFVLVQERHVRLPRRLALVLWVLLVVDVLAVVALTDRGRLPDWGVANPYQRLTALACVLLVALVVLPRLRPSPLVRVLETRGLVVCGLASYSVFLWHEPITRLLTTWGVTMGGRGGLAVNLVMIAVVTGGLAALTYRFVEGPALARKATSRRSDRGRSTDTPFAESPVSVPSRPNGHERTATKDHPDGDGQASDGTRGRWHAE